MPIFKYVAKDFSGKKVSGEVEAVDSKSVVETLRRENFVTLGITKRGEEKFLNTSAAMPKMGGGVNIGEVVNFTRQLSTMLSAGLPLTDALVILQKQTKNANF